MKDHAVVTRGGFHPNYEEEIRYFKENKVYSIQIESNLSCSQGCLYCYASFDNPKVQELPEKDIKTVMSAAVNMDVRCIDWLGGDPLLRKDWYPLMKYAIQLGLINNIWTSGIPLQHREVARKAVEVTKGGFISVHLDTLDEKIYQQLHKGDPKTQIQAILKGVENVQELGKKPEQMMNCITFTKPVAKDVRNTIQYFYEKKGMNTCLTQLCPSGLAQDHREWVPTQKEIQTACEIRDAINYPDSSLSFCSMDTNKFYCGGMICVTVDGDVTPCSVIRKSYGNIHLAPLATIVKNHRKELLFMPLRAPSSMNGTCSSCKNSEVCWGCRATAFYEQGDLYGKDPKCYRNNKK